MRQQSQHLRGVHHGITGGQGKGLRAHGFHALVGLLQLGRHLGVDAVTGHDGDDMAQNAAPVQNQVADQVHGLVAGAFVAVAQTA